VFGHSRGCTKEQQVHSPCPGAVALRFCLNIIPVSLVIDSFSNLIASMQAMRNLYILQVNPVPSIVAIMLMMKIRCTVLLESTNVK